MPVELWGVERREVVLPRPKRRWWQLWKPDEERPRLGIVAAVYHGTFYTAEAATRTADEQGLEDYWLQDQASTSVRTGELLQLGA